MRDEITELVKITTRLQTNVETMTQEVLILRATTEKLQTRISRIESRHSDSKARTAVYAQWAGIITALFAAVISALR